jgi:phytoene synthase
MNTAALDIETGAQPASGSSFYAAMRILPRERRLAMLAIYGFCRAVDDIADHAQASRPDRLRALEAWRSDIGAVYRGNPSPRVGALAPSIAAFDLQQADFIAVLDGMEMDVREDIRAPSLATLDLYCDRVASAVGRLSVRVFGVEQKPGIALAHHLGRALQLTNILRDLDEDAAIGRLYLPWETLSAAGIRSHAPLEALSSPHLDLACAPLAASARQHFREADAIMATCPRRAVRCPRMMAEVYEAILDRLVAQGWSAPRRRVHAPKHRILFAMLRHGIL